MLKRYLKAWLSWAERGGPWPDGSHFSPYLGLCGNAYAWAEKYGMNADTFMMVVANCFGKTSYPFGKLEYIACEREGTMHQDPKRLAWVREYLERVDPS